MRVNAHYADLTDSYLFSSIAHKVSSYQQAHPEADIIRLGIGDVTLPLAPVVVEAMKQAVIEMGRRESFHGYGPEQGYDFLREAIRDYYGERSIQLDMDEIFVSDGAKSDLGNILDLFDRENRVLIPDPVYPVYVDTNVMAGRKVAYLNATASNGFLPLPDPGLKADLIYLCSPNNPTGAVYSREGLKSWVDFALSQGALILFDAAYEAFVADPTLPRSIYEIEGARGCAIEFASFSKTAGFTGVRCGYTVVPKELVFGGASLNRMWLRRQTTKFNGVSYVVQRGAAAVFTPQGKREIAAALAYYRENARVIAQALDAIGMMYTGGKNSPYIWMQCPEGMTSWRFFDRLLDEAHVVGTPGAGFGANGEGFFRLTAFGDQERTRQAVSRLQAMLGGR